MIIHCGGNVMLGIGSEPTFALLINLSTIYHLFPVK
jgi:hypothetical protein